MPAEKALPASRGATRSMSERAPWAAVRLWRKNSPGSSPESRSGWNARKTDAPMARLFTVANPSTTIAWVTVAILRGNPK